jgi:hypothetical protein
VLAGREDRFSSSRKAVRFAGLDVTVQSSDAKARPGACPGKDRRCAVSGAALAGGGAVAESGELVTTDVKVEELAWRASGQRGLHGLA